MKQRRAHFAASGLMRQQRNEDVCHGVDARRARLGESENVDHGSGGCSCVVGGRTRAASIVCGSPVARGTTRHLGVTKHSTFQAGGFPVGAVRLSPDSGRQTPLCTLIGDGGAAVTI